MSSYNKLNDIHWRPSKKSSLLPLYEEKPKNSNFRNASAFHNPISLFWHDRQKRKMLYKAFLGSCIVYIFYYIFLSGPPALPNGQFRFNSTEDVKSKQDQIRNVMKESFADYKKHGWGKDVYHPVSQYGENMGPKPLGWIIVDSLDTLMLMNLTDELADARKWVKDDLTYDFDYAVNTFETTIRMLGGLLSAYYLSNDDIYLNKATDLGNRLLGAFDSPTGIPYASINLKTSQGIKSHADGGASSTAEATTLQLEFKYLSKLTGESLYWDKVEKVMETLYNGNNPKDGLVPIFVHPDTGKFRGNLIRLGSRGDSYYEYLLKQYMQTKESIYLKMYRESVDGVKKHMARVSGGPEKLTFIGELENGINGALSPKMDHLVCFYGGLLALGATEGQQVSKFNKENLWTATRNDDLKFAKELTRTCYKMYNLTETGLAPEIVVFNEAANSKTDFYIKPADTHNLQRPETVESLFILYRITKDPIYRQWGWEIFENFVKYTKVNKEGGYSSIDDVTQPDNIQFRDNMESFWLAETLKYLYLLFEDDDSVMALDKVVFNTEAHPLPMFDMEPLFKTGWRLNSDPNAKFKVEQSLSFGRGRADDHAEFDKKMKELNLDKPINKDKLFIEKEEYHVDGKANQEKIKVASSTSSSTTSTSSSTTSTSTSTTSTAVESIGLSKEEIMEREKNVHKDIKDAPAAIPAAKPLDEQLKEEIKVAEDKNLIIESSEKYPSDNKASIAKKNTPKDKYTQDAIDKKIKEELEAGRDPTEIIDELVKEDVP